MAAKSPLMEQYKSIKNEHKDAFLFYRLGDFYELFYDDAVTVSHELELTLTGKNAGPEGRVPMCGIPYHAAEIQPDIPRAGDRRFPVERSGR